MFFNFNFFSISSQIFHQLDCSDRFNHAAIDLSHHVKPEIRTILFDFVEDVKRTKPCLPRGDLDCLKKNLENVALVGLKKAETLSTGKQRELFADLFTKDSDILKQLKKLKNGNIIESAILICNMFNYKTTKIREYLINLNRH